VTPDEYEALIAQGMDPQDINRPGGVNLGGLPNVGNGSPAFRSQKQRQAVANLHARPDEPDAQEGPQRAHRSPFNMQAYSGASPMQQDFIEQFGPHAQARHLGGMISDVMGAYQDENDSRVAQAREQARMAHESDMAGMEYDALIQRLQMEADQREKDRILQKHLASGVTTRQLVNGEWVDV
jgi:hypothetical protein